MGTVDPGVIGALERAVAADAQNVELRLHLATLLADSGAADRALEHCQATLVLQPDRRDALVLAAQTAASAGLTEQADSYRRMVRALDGATTEPLHGEVDDPAFGAEIEALLHNAAEDSVDIEEPAITLADVGGMESVKTSIERTFLGPMRNPELRRMYGKSLRGGLLLYGPPGCGKTHLARAIAGELGAQFFAVGLHDVLDMYLGQSEQNLHAVFERARRNTPCVLFLDEADALGQKRANLVRSAGRNVVVQLLSELDGIGSDNEGVFVLGATNQPWDIDPALRRPGRFDRTVLVLPPDQPARVQILELQLRDRPVDKVDVKTIAARTDGFSGADVRLLCEAAAELAIEDSLRTGQPRLINAQDFRAALSSVNPSTPAWFDTARNFVTFANQTGEYDDLYTYMRKRKLI